MSSRKGVRSRPVRSAVPLAQTGKVGKRGTVVIPARLRRRFGFEEGSLVITQETSGGVLARPAAAVPLEIYTAERRAEFLLSNAVDARDYARAVKDVRKLGLDPKKIPHRKARRSHLAPLTF